MIKLIEFRTEMKRLKKSMKSVVKRVDCVIVYHTNICRAPQDNNIRPEAILIAQVCMSFGWNTYLE